MLEPLFFLLTGSYWPVVMIALPLLALAVTDASGGSDGPVAAGMRTEHRENPLGIDAPEPKVSWQITQQGRGKKQSAYHLRVAESISDLESGKTVYDTGRVSSTNNLSIPLKGIQLSSATRYWWQVKLWDQEGAEGPWSSPAFFETGLLSSSDWKGQWITSPISGNGFHSGIDADADVTKWVQVDLGSAKTFNAIRLYPAKPYNWNEDMPGFGYPVRFRLEVSDDPDFKASQIVVDRTSEDQPNPGEEPQEFSFAPVQARYVRLTATRLYTRIDSQKLFAMGELRVLDESGNNLAEDKYVSALDSTEAHGWSKAMLTMGVYRETAPSRIAPLFRREFSVDSPVQSARAYVCGLGYYELFINGQRVGDHVLDPPYTIFEKRAYYSTYDVTDLIQQGQNAVGTIIGRGWYGHSPKLILQINIQHTDGSRSSVVTDASWRRGQSPILDNTLYHGEIYDARREQPGWDKPGFDESEWEDVTIADTPTQQLSAQTIQPIRVTENITLKEMKPNNNCWVFDFGQNFSGWCELTVSGPAGNTVVMKHAELLYPDGTINQENLRSARATDMYTLKGEGIEVYHPRFTYHGFRYVQVEGFPGHPGGWDVLKGKVIHTDFPRHGDFQCENDLINQIHKNSVWGFRTNFHSIPTDCPQRDERQGWMGDAHMTADMGFYNFDMAAAYSKFLQDIQDAQGEDGRIPDTVPHIWGTNPGDPMWSAAYHIIVWDMYRHTGDRQLLEKHFEGMKLYVKMLENEADDYIITRNNYGDWVGVVGTPNDLISTGSFILVSRIVADVAKILDRQDDARYFRDLCDKISDAFNRKYFNPETRAYGNGSQYSYVWPLYLGIVPDQYHTQVVDNLVHDIMVNHKGHLSTGFLGARYMFEVLCNEGHADVAYTIINQRDYPSYGYMIENGATTIWELWKLETGPGMNSHNHPAFGFISGWFYRDIAGIVPDWQYPGFEHFDVKPHLMGDLKEASASVETVRGQVSSHWVRDESSLTMSVTVPHNSHATIWVPKNGLESFIITENGTPVWKDDAFVSSVPGLSSGRDAGNWVTIEAGSGEYSFKLTSQ